jgi:hypothetical protein
MNAVAVSLLAASLVGIPLLAGAASPVNAKPEHHYYVVDRNATVAGPFRTFYACSKALEVLELHTKDPGFCTSDWIQSRATASRHTAK